MNPRLTVDVLVESQVGHKLPSGFPSRRVWLHLIVQDANGGVVFELGKLGRERDDNLRQ